MGPNKGPKTAPICISDLPGHSLFGLRCWKACQDDQLRKIPCSWGPQPDDPKGAKTTSCAKSRVQLGAILGPSEEGYREIPQPTLKAKKPRKRPTGLGGRGDNEPNYLTRQWAKARRIHIHIHYNFQVFDQSLVDEITYGNMGMEEAK